MKWKFDDDEKWLWAELGHSSFDVSLLIRPGREAADFHALETVLYREIFRLTWWRFPFAIVLFVGSIFIINDSISTIWKQGWSMHHIWQIIQHIFLFWFLCFGILFSQTSNRWRNGVELAIRLSSSLPPNSVVGLSMTVLRWDEVRLPLNKKSLAPVLYHRLAYVLMHVEGWKPSPAQRKLLQRIALSGRSASTNEQRYPDELRVAALLVLGDEPAALDEKFRAQIAALTTQDVTEESVKAAMQEVLRRL